MKNLLIWTRDLSPLWPLHAPGVVPDTCGVPPRAGEIITVIAGASRPRPRRQGWASRITSPGPGPTQRGRSPGWMGMGHRSVERGALTCMADDLGPGHHTAVLLCDDYGAA